jgi:predicted RNase H-like nuclease
MAGRKAVTGAFVAGIDGCPAGWLVVEHPLHDPAAATARIVATFAEILALDPQPMMIAIDMPIGLPERAIVGGRQADIEARRVLGARKSAIFSVPARTAILEPDYRKACELALLHSDPPRMVSKQMFHIFPKIREVDALMTPALQARIREVHPEVAFAGLNGWMPLDFPKKSKSQPYEPGLALRRNLLQAAGYAPALLATPFKRRHAGPDDLLDATACAWTASRLACGVARRFPAEGPPADSKGLFCEIWG